MYRTDRTFLTDPTTACCRLRIAGLSEEVTPDDLEDIFSKYGKIVGMYVTPGFRYTYLQLETEKQALAAAEAMAHGMFVRNTFLDVRRVVGGSNQQSTENQKQKPTLVSANPDFNRKSKNDTQEVRKLQQHVGGI